MYNINFTNSDIDDEGMGITSNISISTSNQEELMRLMTLAGLTPCAVDSLSIPSDPESVEIIDELPEEADYDYGDNPTSRKGRELDIDPYDYEGTAREPVRYTPARMSDNPLESRSFLSYLNNIINESNKKPSRYSSK